MTEVLLFHHAQGLTQGVRAFADDLRARGHIMHTPDLFDGRAFQIMDEGLAYIGEIGFDEMRERGVRVAHELPPELVYAGFSFGVLPAQKLVQTRPGARGALLFYSCLPICGEWAVGPWPPRRRDRGIHPVGLSTRRRGRSFRTSCSAAPGPWTDLKGWGKPSKAGTVATIATISRTYGECRGMNAGLLQIHGLTTPPNPTWKPLDASYGRGFVESSL